MGVWREDEIGGKGEEVLECVGKRMFQNRKCCLQEVGGRKGKVVEEDASGVAAEEPWNVEESEGDN